MGTRANAFSNDAMGNLDAVGIAAAITKKEVSVEEVTEAAIARAEKVNPLINAIALKTYELSRKNLSQLAKGDLYGVPTFIKDNENVKGLPTQFGTHAFKAVEAKKNSSFVNQFLSTGLNFIGKSTLPEFGLICSTENPKWGITRNPWNTRYTTGGSSSGSAALVASGVVPIALANDGAGSTRIPAACCGLVGLKPSRNRLVNFDGSAVLPLNIGYEGVVTRTVRDTALFYAAAEKHYHHKDLPAMNFVNQPLNRKLKIVFFDNIASHKIGHQDAETYQTMQNTAKLLASLGHEVEQKPLPLDIDDMYAHFLNYYGFLAFVQKNLGRFLLKAKINHGELENFTTGISKQFSDNFLSLSKSLKLLKKEGALIEKAFVDYDIMMTPVLSHTTPTIGHFDPTLPYDEIAKRAVTFAPYTGLQNITGAPAISLPMGTTAIGLPIGVQFVAPLGADKLLLELAYELELAKPWKSIYEVA